MKLYLFFAALTPLFAFGQKPTESLQKAIDNTFGGNYSHRWMVVYHAKSDPKDTLFLLECRHGDFYYQCIEEENVTISNKNSVAIINFLNKSVIISPIPKGKTRRFKPVPVPDSIGKYLNFNETGDTIYSTDNNRWILISEDTVTFCRDDNSHTIKKIISNYGPGRFAEEDFDEEPLTSVEWILQSNKPIDPEYELLKYVKFNGKRWELTQLTSDFEMIDLTRDE
ncbi:MAG: hypothetical protein JNL57_13315 [Bacteroidetes bacterium]|nr:hypothetical protein [Bacteroidota bacterium]